MRRARAERPAARGSAIPKDVRTKSKRARCQVCGAWYRRITMQARSWKSRARAWVPRENLDHIIPIRWCRQHGYLPNQAPNVLSVCHRCNLGKKGAEDALFAGDALGFVKLMVQHGWSFYLMRSLRHYRMDSMIQLVRTVTGSV